MSMADAHNLPLLRDPHTSRTGRSLTNHSLVIKPYTPSVNIAKGGGKVLGQLLDFYNFSAITGQLSTLAEFYRGSHMCMCMSRTIGWG